MQKAGSNNSPKNNFYNYKIKQFLNERFENLTEYKNDNKKKELTNKREFRDNEFMKYVKNRRNVDLDQKREEYIAEKMSQIKRENMDKKIKDKINVLSAKYRFPGSNKYKTTYTNEIKQKIMENAKIAVEGDYKRKFKDEFDKRKLSDNMNDFKSKLKNKFWPKSQYSVNKSQTYTQWLENQKSKHQSLKRTTNDNNYNNKYFGHSKYNDLSIYNIPETISLYSKEENTQQKPSSIFGSLFGKTGGNIKKTSSKKAPLKKPSSKKAPLKKPSSKKALVKKTSSKK
jgi:hypothetical protein